MEHISPQNPVKQDDNRVENMLDRFGNLALVSRSLNSEYSNLPFNEKRQKFINKNKSTVDSLKMSVIYGHETWNDALAKAHEDAMISAIDEYAASLKLRFV
ncbi:HNH endonuclease family protein [Modicisalibacter luteus]|uniref:HNH endonuclease family protein n=1 Tax=Modicisalibacter luteus TaxID=453962 RepID=UPI00362ECEFE